MKGPNQQSRAEGNVLRQFPLSKYVSHAGWWVGGQAAAKAAGRRTCGGGGGGRQANSVNLMKLNGPQPDNQLPHASSPA